MPKPLEYITKDAIIICSEGAAPQKFMPTYNVKHKINDCLVATTIDKIPILNIPSFKICKITQKPCLPIPTTWQSPFDVKIMGQKTLVGRCSMSCGIGGKISFSTSGQNPLPLAEQQEFDALQAKADKQLENSGNQDAVGEAGFWEGFLPIWGSGRDFVNSVQTGNIGGAILNGAFLIWDVASVVAGVFSLGAGTVVMQGIKSVARTAIKKVSLSAFKELGQQALYLLSKESLEKLAARLSHIVVTGCFIKGTPIHTLQGIHPIEEIEVGIKVLAFNQKNGTISYKQVIGTISAENQVIIKITLKNEVISCTPNHPFWIQDRWIRAKNLKKGYLLTTQEQKKVEILAISYAENLQKVYNFEVEEWHTYYVGEMGVLAHNARPCLRRLKHLPEWLKRIEKGNYFNFIRESFYKRNGGFNEVVLDSFKRLDSYIPGKEIVSRKFTQMANVTEKTAKNYIDEMVKKYKPGTKIRNTKRNTDAIAQGGKKLKGEMILEVPVQKSNIPQSILDYATKNKVKLRDIKGNILNP